LGGSIGGSATGGIWSSPTGGVFAPNAQSLDARWTPPEGFSGTATLTLTTSGGNCGTASASKAQTVNAIPETNAGEGGAACDLAFALNAIPSIGSGIWTQTEGPGTSMFTPDPNSPAVTVNASEYGRYTYKWSETNVNCSNSSELIVEYFKRPDINPGTGGNNCGLEYNMNGSTDVGSGTWSLVSGPGNASFSPDTSAGNALVSVSDYGDYVFSWKVVNGACSDSARVNVNFVKQVSADAGEGGVGCDMRFSLEGIGTYGVGTWTKVKGGGNVVFTPDNHQPDAVVTVDKIGEYEFAWTVENIACNSTDIINIEFHDSPIVNAGSDTLICKGSNISLSAQGIGSFFWKPEDLVTAPDVPDPQTTPTETTRFFVTLTDAAGCENSDEILVEVREKPIAFAGPDQDLDYLFETNLKADNPIIYETGNWEVLSGSGRAAYPTLSETSVSNLSVGENKFTWTVTNDVCPSASDTVSIRVRDLLIPTLITPNNDGENDNFVIKGITALGKTELIVFDRRGLEVYRNNNYNNEWNGEDYKGIQLPDDTYFFIVRPENGTPVSNYLVIRRQR